MNETDGNSLVWLQKSALRDPAKFEERMREGYGLQPEQSEKLKRLCTIWNKILSSSIKSSSSKFKVQIYALYEI